MTRTKVLYGIFHVEEALTVKLKSLADYPKHVAAFKRAETQLAFFDHTVPRYKLFEKFLLSLSSFPFFQNNIGEYFRLFPTTVTQSLPMPLAQIDKSLQYIQSLAAPTHLAGTAQNAAAEQEIAHHAKVAKQSKADQKAVNRRLNSLEKENLKLRLAFGMVRQGSSSSPNRGGKGFGKLPMARPSPDHTYYGVYGRTLNGHGWKEPGPCA
jgi:hypothetical protein